MKLVVAGPSGLVANEVIHQSLRDPSITSIVALSRRLYEPSGEVHNDADLSKMHNIVLDDFMNYSEDAKSQLVGADACIWPLGITPRKASGIDFSEVRRVCVDYTMAGVQTLLEVRGKASPPFRFLYVSGIAAETDRSKTPRFQPEYTWMRGDIENDLRAYKAEHPSEVDVCIARPGYITSPTKDVKVPVFEEKEMPYVDVSKMAATMLRYVKEAFKDDTLDNEMLGGFGKEVGGGD